MGSLQGENYHLGNLKQSVKSTHWGSWNLTEYTSVPLLPKDRETSLENSSGKPIILPTSKRGNG